MANFYPSIDTDFHGSDGEREVQEALQKLNDRYVVFHSFCWLGNDKQRRSEGEADFVVLHPEKGILSIEVKAGGIDYREGNWIQVNRRDGSEKVIDPLGQAAESQHHILNLLRQRLPGGCYPVVGRAAWFTSVVLDPKLPLPPSAAADILLDFSALSDAETALNKAFQYWQENLGFPSRPISSAAFRQIIRILMPSFHIVPAVGSMIREDQSHYIRMTQQQSAILQFLTEQPVASIHGLAGTGKTLLAIEKAQMVAASGQKVLYLCFNEFLLHYLRNRYPDSRNITFHNVRSLAEEILGKGSYSIDKIIPAFEEYFDTVYDDTRWPYPNIVIDEGQDLDDCLLEHLSCLMELMGGTFYIFYDRNQAIIKNTSAKENWIDRHADCRLVLYRNCRNTAEIASTIGSIIHASVKHYVNDLHGYLPKASFYTTEKELVGIAAGFVQRMLQEKVPLQDMVILSVHSVAHSMLQGVHELAGIPVSNTPAPGQLWFTSIRKFKGLEAKAVLIIDLHISELPKLLIQRLLYVGASRANSCLQVGICDDIPKKDYAPVLASLTDQPVSPNHKGLLEALCLERLP